MFWGQLWVTGASNILRDGRAQAEQERGVPRTPHEPSEKGDSVYVYLTLLFQASFFCSESNLKATWSEGTSVPPTVKWISVSPSHFPAEGSLQGTWKHWVGIIIPESLLGLMITLLNSSFPPHHLCSLWIPRYQPNLNWAWPWDAHQGWRPLTVCGCPVGWALLPKTVELWACPSTFPDLGFLSIRWGDCLLTLRVYEL